MDTAEEALFAFPKQVDVLIDVSNVSSWAWVLESMDKNGSLVARVSIGKLPLKRRKKNSDDPAQPFPFLKYADWVGDMFKVHFGVALWRFAWISDFLCFFFGRAVSHQGLDWTVRSKLTLREQRSYLNIMLHQSKSCEGRCPTPICMLRILFSALSLLALCSFPNQCSVGAVVKSIRHVTGDPRPLLVKPRNKQIHIHTHHNAGFILQ